MLIDTNFLQTLEPISAISSQDGDPYALQTTFDWCIVGTTECTLVKIESVSCNQTAAKNSETNNILQSWPKYMIQTLVLVCNSAVREMFNFNF